MMIASAMAALSLKLTQAEAYECRAPILFCICRALWCTPSPVFFSQRTSTDLDARTGCDLVEVDTVEMN